MKNNELDERLTKALSPRLNQMPLQLKDEMEELLDHLPARGKLKPRKWTSIKIAAASLILLITFGSAALLSSPSLAEAIKLKWQSIFQESGDPALITETGGNDMTVLKEITDVGYTMRIHETMFDGMRLSFSYSISRKEGLSSLSWVEPRFDLNESVAESYPGIVMTDHSKAQDDYKTGIVSYYFTNQSPDELMLKMDVRSITIHDSTGQTETIAGDWSFELPMVKSGIVSETFAKMPNQIQRDGVLFKINRIRTAERSTLWEFHWEFPEELRPNSLSDDEPSYDVHYQIAVDGNTVEHTALDSKENGRVKINDKLVPGRYYSTHTLVTEQLPISFKKIVVTPILRTWTKNSVSGLWGFTEKTLADFSITADSIEMAE